MAGLAGGVGLRAHVPPSPSLHQRHTPSCFCSASSCPCCCCPWGWRCCCWSGRCGEEAGLRCWRRWVCSGFSPHHSRPRGSGVGSSAPTSAARSTRCCKDSPAHYLPGRARPFPTAQRNGWGRPSGSAAPWWCSAPAATRLPARLGPASGPTPIASSEVSRLTSTYAPRGSGPA